jgi:hypothetical protein
VFAGFLLKEYDRATMAVVSMYNAREVNELVAKLGDKSMVETALTSLQAYA